jgi:methylenetetrahydrofolate dehydrogenase (NADP+)/methenyltetrahydrofolate cyclohydrolase
LEYYNYDIQHHPHTISMLGESDLIGKPLTTILRNYWNTVHAFDEFSDQQQVRDMCKSSDIIISATGKLHLVDDSFVRDDQSQTLIDVGRGLIDGKPTWDINAESVAWKIAAITPIPGGVWPVTVASLFWNMVSLREMRDIF